MKRLFFFIKNGYDKSNEELDIITLLKLLLIYFSSTFLLAIINIFIVKYFGITHKSLHLSSTFKTILVGVILAPIYEEIFFRSLLIFNKRTVFIFFTNLLIIIPITYVNNKITWMAVILTFTFLILLILLLSDIASIQRFIKLHIRKFYYISSILF